MMRFFFLLALPFVVAGCSVDSFDATALLTNASGDEVSVKVEIADDATEQIQGLMFREEVPEGTGMLFVYPEPQVLSFWMKNTLVPLDILFFDSEGRFISSKTMDPCTADPCRTYPSAEPVRYALEVAAGFLEEKRIGSGWVLVIDN